MVCWELWHALLLLLLQLIRRAHYIDVIFSLLSMTPAGENEKGFLNFLVSIRVSDVLSFHLS